MVTLALDTSHPVGSVALARDGELLSRETFREPSSHLVALGQSVDRALADAGLAMSAIERIAVVTGPGSFTGLRIGLSFAKGLHAARATPMVALDALRLLALPHLAKHGRVAAMIDARRGEVYAAVYQGPPAGAMDPAAVTIGVSPQAVAPAEWLASLDSAPQVFVGTGALAHRDAILAAFPSAVIIAGDDAYPSTAFFAVIAHRMQPLDENGVRALEPFYIRASGAERVKLRAHAQRAEHGDE